MPPYRVEEFGRGKNYHKVMNKWWIEGKPFKFRDNEIYPTTNLREPFIYDVALLKFFLGKNDVTHFMES